MNTTPNSFPNIRGRISQIIVENAVKNANASVDRSTPGPAIPMEAVASNERRARPEVLPICIVGAGAAGLYAAMMLQDLGLDFVILEANKTRVGGRVYTHRFNPDALNAPVNTPERYNYIDMGAMRFPRIDAQKPFFNLCDRVGITDLLVEYKFKDLQTFTSYNGITVKPAEVNESLDIFKVGTKHGGIVPQNFLDRKGDSNPPVYPNDGEAWITPVMQPFVDEFKKGDIDAAWAKVCQYDSLSTRAFMSRTDPSPSADPSKLDPSYPNYPSAVIDWLEMLNTGTGMWNGSFVESVLQAIEFGDISAPTNPGSQATDDKSRPPWYCLDGGSDRVIMAMLAYLTPTNQPLLGKTVVGIKPSENGEIMMVQVKGESQPRRFSQVICTVPLGCLSSVDMTDCKLSFTQKTAIRSLSYSASTKVALKFNARWWENPKVMGEGKTIMGGVTKTDLPVRMVVYPSYGRKCPADATLPGVLIASYNWAQDAARFGALVADGDAESEDTLIDIVRENLKTLHGVTDDQMGPIVAKKVQAWYNSPYSRGAFASFGPSSFGTTNAQGIQTGVSLHASLKAPAAGGRLHFAGEATSIQHAWVVGALNSAWRAVYMALIWDEPKRTDLLSKYLKPEEENLENLKQLALLGSYAMI